MKRTPKQIVSFGSGRGELEATFTNLKIPVIGVDPSPSVPAIFKKTMKEWAGVG